MQEHRKALEVVPLRLELPVPEHRCQGSARWQVRRRAVLGAANPPQVLRVRQRQFLAPGHHWGLRLDQRTRRHPVRDLARALVRGQDLGLVQGRPGQQTQVHPEYPRLDLGRDLGWVLCSE